MGIFETVLQFDWAIRLALGGLVLTTLAWLVAMIVALFSKRNSKAGIRRFEIAVGVLSVLFIGSMTHVGRAMGQTPETMPEVAVEAAPSAGGGSGTCASVRPGMKTSQVRTLLGTPSLEQTSEDTRGPGARVMVFDDSRCAVHLLNGVVDQVE